jgi:hypothetical protein
MRLDKVLLFMPLNLQGEKGIKLLASDFNQTNKSRGRNKSVEERIQKQNRLAPGDPLQYLTAKESPVLLTRLFCHFSAKFHGTHALPVVSGSHTETLTTCSSLRMESFCVQQLI